MNSILSVNQQKIVDSTKDNILVIACPGSGKTHTLIAKYINMITNHNLLPEETIMITFTKKAGIEMLNRLNKIIPDKIPYHVGTIHGLSYKILKEYNKFKNIVMDDQDTKDLLNSIIDNQNLLNYDIIKSKIDQIIDQASISYPFDIKSILIKNNLEKYFKEFKLIYKLFLQKKKKENLVDFNDLMSMFHNFLISEKSLIFKNKIKYVFFDEYQDVNSIQNNILLKLSENSKIMVVGDDAQSIYSFRGSNVKYILNYNLNKPSETYLLEDNYRSNSSIVDFCQNIISNNLNQFKKNINSNLKSENYKPNIYKFNNKKEQYEWIVKNILENLIDINLSDIAILSRKNNLLNEIELYLITNKINVSKNIGSSLLNKSYIKEIIAFIIIIINPKSSIHYKKIINLHQKYYKNEQEEFIELDNILIEIKKQKSQEQKIKMIIQYLEKFWDKQNKQDINILLKYLKNSSFEDFVNNLNLNEDTKDENTLYLSTIHGSKGLEWKYVYILDVNPFIRTKYYLDEFEEIEEERRLFYVACSRAKDKLFITYNNFMSQLLKEINPIYYNSNSINNDDKFIPSFNIYLDIKNYLNMYGYSTINKTLSKIINTNYIVNKKIELSNNINNNIIDKLIKKFIFKIVEEKYIKKNIDINWNIIIDNITENIDHKIFLINNFNNLIKGITNIYNKINPNKILIDYTISFGSVSGNIDLLFDNYIIEIGDNLGCINICEKLLHCYLFLKNNINITNIFFYNPINGNNNDFLINNINIIEFKKIIYNSK